MDISRGKLVLVLIFSQMVMSHRNTIKLEWQAQILATKLELMTGFHHHQNHNLQPHLITKLMTRPRNLSFPPQAQKSNHTYGCTTPSSVSWLAWFYSPFTTVFVQNIKTSRNQITKHMLMMSHFHIELDNQELRFKYEKIRFRFK